MQTGDPLQLFVLLVKILSEWSIHLFVCSITSFVKQKSYQWNDAVAKLLLKQVDDGIRLTNDIKKV